MLLRIVERGPDAKPRSLGEFTWTKGKLVMKVESVEGARKVMVSIRSEFIEHSKSSVRTSMERLVEKYHGDYFWVHYEP